MEDPFEIDGLPVGRPLPEWSPRPAPQAERRTGRWCWMEPLTPEHDAAVVEALLEDGDPRRFTYLASEFRADAGGISDFLGSLRASDDLRTVVIGRRGRPAEGVASLMRIDTANGSVEVGSIVYGPGLARSTAATEAMYLLASYAFDDLGYRRYEWKCDALNAASRRAAERLGFRYEGTWRNALVYKGRNRDTAWYSITDDEWPSVRQALEAWLDPANFRDGVQIRRLEEIRGGD